MATVVRRHRAGPVGTAVAVVLVVAVLVGCEREADDSALTEGLLVLSGDVGAVTLTLREGDGVRGRTLPLPDPATTWVSAGRTNVLLATLVGGPTYVSDPVGEDELSWRLVEPVTLTDRPPEPPLFFGTWDPPGGAYAQLGTDFAADGGMRAVVVDPALEQAVEVALNERRPVAAPPAWIDDDRVVFVTATSDGTESVIVDSATQESEPGPAGVVLVTTSADATMAAVWHGPGNPVEVLSTEAWLADEPARTRVEPPDGAAAPAALALDGPGERLAVVWTDDAGAPTSITVNAAARDWARVATLDLGAARAASVAWLR